jgi:polysaccharide biosynthesis transport protein
MPDWTVAPRVEPADRESPSNETIRPAQLIKALRRSWRLTLACGVIFAGVGYVAAKTLLPQQFTASGTVAVDNRSVAIPALEGALKSPMLADPMPMVRSEVALLQSPSLIRAVVDDLKLKQDPDFNPTLRPPTPMDRAKRWLVRVLPSGLRDTGVTVGLLPSPAQLLPASPRIVDSLVMGTVERRLGVSNYGQSLVITVEFRAASATTAAAVVNDLLKHYIAEKEAAVTAADTAANSTLTRRLRAVRDRVDELEQKIQSTRQAYEIVRTRAGTVGEQELEELSAALTRASTQRASLEAEYARAATLAPLGGGAPGLEGLNSGTVAVLREREADAARRVAELSQTYGPRYPALRSAEAQLRSARAAVARETGRAVAALSAQVQTARQREADLRRQLATAQTKASKLAVVQARLQQYQKDAAAERTLYQSLLISADQTQGSRSGLSEVNARIVSLATPPAFPSSPRPKLAGALGLLGGIAFGGCVTLLRRHRHGAFVDAEDLADETGLRAIAPIPRVPGAADRTCLPEEVADDPRGELAEALRVLRTQLPATRSGTPRTLLFVSPTGGEGCSSVAAAFARLSALDGLRTLLIEGDLAAPSLAALLGAQESNGLVDALLGHEHWMEVVQPDPRSSLDCLLVAGPAAGANRLLQTTHLQSLLAEAKEEYNVVVLDAPAVAQSANALTLASAVDAILLVLAAGETTPDRLHRALEAITTAAARPLVLVLNKA